MVKRSAGAQGEYEVGSTRGSLWLALKQGRNFRGVTFFRMVLDLSSVNLYDLHI